MQRTISEAGCLNVISPNSLRATNEEQSEKCVKPFLVLTALKVRRLQGGKSSTVEITGRLTGSSELHRNSFRFAERVQPFEGTVTVQEIRIETQHLQVGQLLERSLGNCGQVVVGQVPVRKE